MNYSTITFNQIFNTSHKFLYVLFFLGVVLVQSGYAQIQSDFYENIVPEVSEAASFGTFGNTSIDYYTATPNISVHLFTLKSRHLSLPIGLSYNSQGVQITDEPSWVGQNWHLNAGGSITRNMHGLPDELPNDGYLTTVAETNNFNINEINIEDWVTFYEKKERDTEPDEFMVSLPGRSLKFVFDELGQAQCIPYQKVRIEYFQLNGRINKFVVTTEDGTTYTFGEDPLAVEESKITTVTTKYHYESDGFKFFDRDFYNHNPGLFAPLQSEGPDHLNNLKDEIDYQAFNERLLPREEDEEQDLPLTINWYNSRWHLVKIENPMNDIINLAYTNGPEFAIEHSPRKTRIEQVMSYTKTDVMLLEESHWYTTTGHTYAVSGNINRIAYNDNGLGGTLIYASNLPHSGTLHNHNWEPSAWDPTNASQGPMRCRHFVENVGVRAVARFGSTPAGSKPSMLDAHDLIALDHTHTGIPPLIKDFNYTVQDAFPYSEVYPNGGGEIVSNTTVNIRTKVLAKITSSGGAHIDCFVHNNQLERIELLNNEDTYIQGYTFGYKTYNGRTFLDQATQVAANGLGTVPYQFSYMNPGGLPEQGSDQVNAYGHFIEYSSWGTLKEIKYPTGGSTEYFYSYYNGNKLDEIKDFSSTEVLSAHRRFTYEQRANTAEAPKFETYQNVKVHGTSPAEYLKYRITTNFPQNQLLTSKGAYRGYGKVTEKILATDNETPLGKTEYLFTTSDTKKVHEQSFDCANIPATIAEKFAGTVSTSSETNIFPFPRPRKREFMQGLMTAKTVCNTSGKKLQEEKYSYKLNPSGHLTKTIKGFVGGKFNYEISPTRDYWYGREAVQNKKHRYTNTEYITDWVVLDQKTSTTYEQGDDSRSITTTTSYQYREGDNNMIEEVTTLVDGTNQKTKIQYPYDYKSKLEYTNSDEFHLNDQEEALRELYANHQLSQPVEIINIKDGKITNGSLNLFKLQNDMVLIDEVHKLNTDIPFTYSDDFLSHVILEPSGQAEFSTQFNKSEYYKRVIELSYDATGNLIETKGKDGLVTSYGYGYNNTLMTSMTSENQTTTYEHIPLVGITKVTDPNGQETTYEYDEFNRLKNIKDHNGDIVEHYRYNYGGQYDLQGKSLEIDGCVWPGKDDFIEVPSGFFVPYGEVAYVWDFGDNTVIETAENVIPKHGYAADGIYTLSVTRTSGQFYGTQTVTQEVNVDNGSIEVKTLSKVPTGSPHVYNVKLGAQESNPTCNPIASYRWYRSRDNGLTYEQIGIEATVDITAYQGLWIKLVTITTDGRVFTDEHVFNYYSYMGRFELNALNINASENCILKGLPVSFSTSEYVVVDGPIEMIWDFGDGTQPVTNNHVNAQTHTYTSSGTRTITLSIAYRENGIDSVAHISRTVEVKDNDSAVATLGRTIQVEEHGPTYRIDAQVDLYHDVNCVQSIHWYVDGEYEPSYNNDNSLGMLINAGEDKFVKAIIYDVKGDPYETQTIAIGDGALSDEFMSWTELNAIDMNAGGSCNLKGESLSFSMTGTLDLPAPYTVTWDFGDGTSIDDNSGSVSHVYANAGSYQTKLTISSLIHPDKVITESVTVNSNDGKTVLLVGDFQEGPHGGRIDAQYSLSHSISCIKKYEWYVNGSLISNNYATYGMLFDVNETKVVKVKVTDDANNVYLTNEVTQGSPSFMTQAEFNTVSLNASSSCYVTGNNVSFSFSESVTLAGSSSVNWNFKDGTTLSSGGFSGRGHTYSQTGTYNVSVAISNPFYNNRTLTKSVTINSPATYSLSHSFVELVGGTGLAGFNVTATKTSGTSCGSVRWEEKRNGSSSWSTISESGSGIYYTARDGDQLRLKGTSQTITFVVDGGPPSGSGGGDDGGFGK
ncbi:PKD domain-containing protein [Reichenbachiella sp.]